MDDRIDYLDIAGRFAAALDACDYLEAEGFLTPDCRYHTGNDRVLVGPQSILASYRNSDERARRDFDHVAYTSVVTTDDSGGVRLSFFDELGRNGRIHTFQCDQVVHFGAEGKIDRIELQERPGERARLKQFQSSFDDAEVA